MLGRIVGKIDKCVTDDKGNMIVSFVVCGTDRYEAKQCVAAINTALASGKERLRIDVDLYREKRSSQANNYFWQLCDKVAKVVGSTKVEIYQQYIKEQGIFRQYEINEKAAASFCTLWEMQGIGWITEKVDYSRTPGFEIINAYFGSSIYNKKQMSRLTNSIVADCEELGIETKTPAELAEMLDLWEAGK